MLIVGATVPTQRAFLMTGLVLFAILVDRTALSMRLVAWAATAVLLLAPESLLGPSFQNVVRGGDGADRHLRGAWATGRRRGGRRRGGSAGP